MASETESGVLNFGCRLNAYEGEAIRAALARHGRDDIVVVNTCAVTAEAEKQARQAIRRLRRDRPGARIVVTGCAAQVNPQGFADMTEVDHVIGNREKLGEVLWRDLDKDAPRVSVGDIQRDTPPALPAVSHFPGRPRAYLEIQQGCDHRCTFCIIPYGRGPSRSLPLGAVAEQARILAARGYREFVLTGVDITSYGHDLPGQPTLGQATRRLLALVPQIERLRFSSLDPAEIDADLLQLYADEPRVMPHAHLSLQAGDDLILKRMKRRHSRAQALEMAHRLQQLRPGIALGADLIAGFPTESDAAFEQSRSLIEAAGLAFVHVFPYSPRPGTPAARMPQLPVELRRARAALLRADADAALNRFLAGRIGREASILVEQEGVGRDETYAAVALPGHMAKGSIVTARIAAVRDGKLWLDAA
ncbi:MAG: tRNA (N(6)-L-threonylcarbamoyladenosine(37)-C(2))-methylthiotransferase MtaB [Ferrovibrio sp.]|uniref:tRNA (N(6)-L-threonylcarbamoyladenosine(37)-C(2))- methylthiotransferase MtaB n=1 Tax=Ferrovibrio sp. TaxID=1917215 RepID=UPI00262C9E9D|nr:tRNA (N(6)-L-threonylcarbamoyladenosine(37)-C(2))-methylthiotransferase MtaB [Ferrovibrio sp.]MCW0235910.1 tRNA (N(6)-L-threonylcarbamoyladenosine(37)-C(2))-methylthiotransferase MtaB [Ferrovibrio sp.]